MLPLNQDFTNTSILPADREYGYSALSAAAWQSGWMGEQGSKAAV